MVPRELRSPGYHLQGTYLETSYWCDEWKALHLPKVRRLDCEASEQDPVGAFPELPEVCARVLQRIAPMVLRPSACLLL